jgi:hypothetical protein
MNLPNRKERRKLAKEMGLLKKDKIKKNESFSKSLGKLIHLRNLTEQRNLDKKND